MLHLMDRRAAAGGQGWLLSEVLRVHDPAHEEQHAAVVVPHEEDERVVCLEELLAEGADSLDAGESRRRPPHTVLRHLHH